MTQDEPNPGRDAVMAWVRSNAALSREGLIDVIKQTQDRFLSVVNGCAESAMRQSESDWSVNDLLRHAINAEERVTRQIAGLANGRDEDMYNVPDGEEMQIPDQGQSFAQLIERLESTNSGILDLLATLPADANYELKCAHDYFGPMNALEWAGFQVFHDTDHTEYAVALASRNERATQ